MTDAIQDALNKYDVAHERSEGSDRAMRLDARYRGEADVRRGREHWQERGTREKRNFAWKGSDPSSEEQDSGETGMVKKGGWGNRKWLAGRQRREMNEEEQFERDGNDFQGRDRGEERGRSK